MDSNELIRFIDDNWGKISISDMQEKMNVSLYVLLSTAFNHNFYLRDSKIIERRGWTADEDRFLEEYSNRISIDEACNLFHRSRPATYQRVKLLGLNNMIKKRKM